jgi:hypothetical protein
MRLSNWAVLGMGMLAGAISFAIAKSLVPSSTPLLGHDIALAHRIGFVFPAMAGLWAGWIQKSLGRMVLGMTCGSLVGYAYQILCGEDPESRLVGALFVFPACCGGMLAGLIGSDREPWRAGFRARFLKGTLAGFVCGLSYFVVVILGLFLADVTLETYLRAIWMAGVTGLAVGGGLFFVLFRWALGLNRPSTTPGEAGPVPPPAA